MQEHPDTVGGAMLSGMREALRALRLLKGDSDEVGATAAAAVDTSTARKRRQVTHILGFRVSHKTFSACLSRPLSPLPSGPHVFARLKSSDDLGLV